MEEQVWFLTKALTRIFDQCFQELRLMEIWQLKLTDAQILVKERTHVGNAPKHNVHSVQIDKGNLPSNFSSR